MCNFAIDVQLQLLSFDQKGWSLCRRCLHYHITLNYHSSRLFVIIIDVLSLGSIFIFTPSKITRPCEPGNFTGNIYNMQQPSVMMSYLSLRSTVNTLNYHSSRLFGIIIDVLSLDSIFIFMPSENPQLQAQPQSQRKINFAQPQTHMCYRSVVTLSLPPSIKPTAMAHGSKRSITTIIHIN